MDHEDEAEMLDMGEIDGQSDPETEDEVDHAEFVAEMMEAGDEVLPVVNNEVKMQPLKLNVFQI